MIKTAALAALVIFGVSVKPGWAQEPQMKDPQAGHKMIMEAPAAAENPNSNGAEKEGGVSSMLDSMEMGSMLGGAPPPDARDPHVYAEGYDFGPLKLRLADTHGLDAVLMDHLEAVRSGGNTSSAYDLQAWYGRTFDRAVIKAEGDYDDSRFTEARTELLWSHSVAAFWDTQLGGRRDSAGGSDRTWLAFGVQGLAPYWFELEATGYLGENGRTTIRLDVSYELLLTQKWILQPRVEVNAYGKNEAPRGLASGLSDAVAQLRLRYEILREFAPYVGIEWARQVGETRHLARAAGEKTGERRFVAGLRFWF